MNKKNKNNFFRERNFSLLTFYFQKEGCRTTNIIIRSFSKIFCFTRTVAYQKIVQYIRMLCTGCFILNGIVEYCESMMSHFKRNKKSYEKERPIDVFHLVTRKGNET